MDIVTRLKQFMDFCELPSSQFADQAQIPRPTLSQILNGRNKKISNELISKLHEAFPQLNVMWLMFGDGDMVYGENIEFSEPLIEQNLFNIEEQQPIVQHDAFPELAQKQNTNSIASTQNVQNSKPEAPKPIIQTSNTASQQGQTVVPIPITPDNSKKIASIMVFYTDNSFERFMPAEAMGK